MDLSMGFLELLYVAYEHARKILVIYILWDVVFFVLFLLSFTAVWNMLYA